MHTIKDLITALIPLVAVLAVFSPGIIWIWTNHQRRMRELDLEIMNKKALGSNTTAGVSNAEVEALRQELRALKDTTMQYDLSFDAALQTMERRVQTLEIDRRAVATENWAQLRNGKSGE